MARLPLFALAAASVLLLAGQTGCHAPKHRSSSPAVSVGHGHGPPAHAPAHGYHKKHRYHYYSTANVYFDVDRELYFYVDAGEWKVAVSLPSTIVIEVGEGVTLELETDKPYAAEHPGKGKAKGKKKKY